MPAAGNGASLLLLLATAALLPALTHQSPCVPGLDYLDLVSGGYGLRSNATNPRDCCASCGAQDGCLHFAWVHAHQEAGPVLGLSGPPGCWLKIEGFVWTRRMNTPTAGNRAPRAAAAAVVAPTGGGAPSRMLERAVGYEAFYVVVGGDCSADESCNATLGMCDEPEVNSTRSSCSHCLGGAIHAPTGGTIGDCPESGDLAHGQSCQVGCPEGMYPSGQHPTCDTGAIRGQKGGAYSIDCMQCTQCEGIYEPEDGNMGDCPTDGTLPWNQGCVQRCDPDFIVVNTSHHPYCMCGASGGPQLSAMSVSCEPCTTCGSWGIFLSVLMIGGPAGCCWIVYYFQLLPTKLRKKMRTRVPARFRASKKSAKVGA